MNTRSNIESIVLIISTYLVIWYQQSIVGRFSFAILGLVVICLVFLIRLARSRVTIRKFALGLSLLPLTAAMISIVPSIGQPGYYITDIVGTLVYYFAFWFSVLAIASLFNVRGLRNAFLIGIEIAGVFSACFGLVQFVQWILNMDVVYLFPTNPTFFGMGVLSLLKRGYLRITGPLAEPSEFAIFLTLVLFCEIESGRQNWLRIILYLSCILLSISLSAYIALVIGGLALLLRQRSRRHSKHFEGYKKYKQLALRLFATALILGVLLVVSAEFREKISEIVNVASRRISVTGDSSVKYRHSSIAEGFRLWRDGSTTNHFLGYGAGNYGLLGAIDTSSKSMITKILMEEGIIGLSLHLVFWIVLFKRMLQKQLVYISVFSVCLISWVINDVFVTIPYYIFMGFLIGTIVLQNEPQKHEVFKSTSVMLDNLSGTRHEKC